MIVLRDSTLSERITDVALRAAVSKGFTDVAQGKEYDDTVHGYAVVVEPGDDAAVIEEQIGTALLSDPHRPIHFGDPKFTPPLETLEEHESFFPGVLVPGDGDFGVAVFIPKAKGVDAKLLAMCAAFAETLVSTEGNSDD